MISGPQWDEWVNGCNIHVIYIKGPSQSALVQNSAKGIQVDGGFCFCFALWTLSHLEFICSFVKTCRFCSGLVSFHAEKNTEQTWERSVFSLARRVWGGSNRSKYGKKVLCSGLVHLEFTPNICISGKSVFFTSAASQNAKHTWLSEGV